MYVNTLDTCLCMYFCAKNTPFPSEKDHSCLESRLENLVSKSRSVWSRYNLKSREMSEMRTRPTSMMWWWWGDYPDKRQPVPGAVCLMPTRILMRSPNARIFHTNWYTPFFTLHLHSLNVIEVCVGVSVSAQHRMFVKPSIQHVT
jgi:hypothetical protein